MARKIAIAAAVLSLVVVATPVFALSLPLDTPVVFKFFNFDMGTLYQVANGTYVGETTLDGLTQIPPLGGYPNEDGWGIFRVALITNPAGTVEYWNSATADAELTGMFWGLRDVYVAQPSGPSQQEIDGKYMHVSLYEDSAKNFDPELGSSGRTGEDAYTTVTDGTKLFEAITVPGIVHDVGQGAGLTTEFHTMFNAADTTSDGRFNIDILPDSGTMWCHEDGGFDTNKLGAPIGEHEEWTRPIAGTNINPGFYGTLDSPGSDMKFQFTGTANVDPFTGGPLVGDWLILSNDPAYAWTGVPEPATMSLVGLGLLALVRRRRRA